MIETPPPARRKSWRPLLVVSVALLLLLPPSIAFIIDRAFEEQPDPAAENPRSPRSTAPSDAPRLPPMRPTRKPGQKRFIMTADDIATAANHVLKRKRIEGQVSSRIEDNRLYLKANLHLPDRQTRPYLNIELWAEEHPDGLQITWLRVGQLALRAPWSDWFLKGIQYVPPYSHFGGVENRVIQGIHIQKNQLQVTLNWDSDFLKNLSTSLLDLSDLPRLRVYQQRLIEKLSDGTSIRYIRLGTLMQNLFQLAQQRSSEPGSDPVAENRALITVLSAYAGGKDLAERIAIETELPERRMLLNGRVDTAQHFIGSAAVAMSGQGTLVSLIGLSKELHDTHHGMGFSFIDLAADEAGITFGKYAVRSPAKARRIQAFMARSARESQFIPVLKDLPESMDQEAFTRRFRDIDSPAFKTLKRTIQDRIGSLPIYQEG